MKLVFLETTIPLVCPTCKGELSDALSCASCGRAFSMRGNIPMLARTDIVLQAETDERSDLDNRIKNFFKRWPGLYQWLIRLVAPVLFTGLSAKKFLARELPTNGVALNLGSGPTTVHPRALNVDIFPFPNVHLLADADALPFPDNTFDAVCTEQVLEHVPRPFDAVREIIRVTKPGGLIYTAVPFVFPYHPSPKDYMRYSLDGLRDMFAGCDEATSGILCGPVSGWLITTAAAFSVFFSFGIRPLQKALNYFFQLLLSPFKLLDLIYAHLPTADVLPAGVYFVARKKSA